MITDLRRGRFRAMRRLLGILGRVLRESVWIAVAVAIVYGGVRGFQMLGEARPVVQAAPVERPITLVATTSLVPLSGPLPVRGEGFVRPYRQVELSALGSGRIVELHPALIARQGTFREGEVLVRLDDSAERASLDQIAANIAATEARLDLNRTQLERTRTLRDSGSASQGALDQLAAENAELLASLDGLRAALAVGQVALDNRVVLAPFDGAVLTKLLDVGSVVGAGEAIATIYTSDRLDVDIAIREADAALIPGLFDGQEARASVSVRFAGREVTWDARVIRVAPELDPQTRTLSVTVEIADPEGGLSDGATDVASGAPPALINAFARVVVDGARPDQTYGIPSTALRGGEAIWVLHDDRLRILPAQLVHVDGETSYVRVADVPVGASLILTELASPVPGMTLRDVAGMSTAAMTE